MTAASPAKRPLLPIALVALVAILVHARGLEGGPVWLDENTVPWLEIPGTATRSVLEFVLNGIVAPTDRTPSAAWEPIPAICLATCAALGEARLVAMHLVGILAHALAGLALLRLALSLGAGRFAATSSALLFAVHPAVVESTTYLTAAGAPLAGALSLFALDLLLRDGARRPLASAGVLAFLALSCDVQAVAVLPVAWVLLRPGERRGPLLALLAGAVAAWLARSLAHGSLSGGLGDELRAAAESWPSLLPGVETLGGALSILAWPADWNPFRTPLEKPTLGALVPELVILLGACALAVVGHRRRWAGSRELLALFAALLPLAIASERLNVFPLADHHLYLGVALFSLFLGRLVARLPHRPAMALVTVTVAACIWEDQRRIPLWENDRTFYAAALERNPESPYAHWLFASELLEEYERRGNGESLYEARAVIESGQDLLDLSKQEDSTVFATPEDFRQMNLALGFCLLALADVDGYFDYETPRAVFAMISEADPSNVRALLGAGMASFGLGDLDAAEEAFRRALSIQPDSGDALHDLGRLEIERENWRSAEEHFEKALIARPDNLSDRVWLARSLLQQGRAAEARHEVEVAHELYPYHPEPMVLLGIIALDRGDPGRALEWIDRALAAEPKNGFARLQRGHAFRRKAEALIAAGENARATTELSNAMFEYRRATQLMPSFEAYFSLADVLMVLGESEPALEQMLEAYRLQNNEAVLGDMRPALAQAFPDLVEAHFGFGSADYRRGNADAAEVWAESALEIDPAHAPSLHLRGLIRRLREDLEGAVTDFKAAALALPSSFEMRHDLAFALIEAGRPDEALQHLELALELAPTPSSSGDPNEAQAVDKLRAKLERAIEQIRGG